MTRVTINPEPPPAAVPAMPLAPRPETPARAPAAANRRMPARTAAPRTRPLADRRPETPAQSWQQHAPPWLVSAAFHMLVLLVLGLWFFSAGEPPLELTLRFHERLGEQLDEMTIETLTGDLLDQEIVVTPDNLQPVEEPLALPQFIELGPLSTAATRALSPQPLGMAYMGREPGTKEALLAAYGGDATTESAVMEALRWLARNQLSSGLWSLAGPYRDGSGVENKKAATAMALLAFQGAGYTHKGDPNEPFTRIVERGWTALLKEQAEDGSFLGEYYHHMLYTHAQCTIALCELYAMTRDESLRQPAQRAINYCVNIQDAMGGWRYTPGQGSDLSVTGWFVMALQSARIAGLQVPSDVFLRVGDFLDLVAHHDGARYSYRPNEQEKRSMTAEGLLCRQYLGWKQDDPRLVSGVEHLLANPVKWDDRDVYYWYYATQVCHHMEGESWRKWNAEMKQVLPANQIKTGRERGSWDITDDPYGYQGGRLYVTCMSAYMLEVYYRHLPLYRQNFAR